MPEDNEIDESSDIASEDEYDEAENSKNDHDDNIMGDQSYLTEGEHEDGDGAAPVKKRKLTQKILRDREGRKQGEPVLLARGHI